jgi:hypothetical protein
MFSLVSGAKISGTKEFFVWDKVSGAKISGTKEFFVWDKRSIL